MAAFNLLVINDFSSRHSSGNISDMSTSIYILDDDVYFGHCLKKSLESAIDDVKYFKTQRNFFKAMQSASPNVVILDYHLDKTTGLEVMDQIKDSGIRTEVLMVSSQQNEKIVLKAYKKGALAYFEKSTSTFEHVRKSIEWMLLLSYDFQHPLKQESFGKIWMQWEKKR